MNWVKLGKSARECSVDIAWAQWGAVARFVTRPLQVQSTIDPEALLLASLYLGEHERRLTRLTAWWAVKGARLLSVQRTKNLLPLYPPVVEQRLGEFALIAARDGHDIRWKSLAGSAQSYHPSPRPKDLASTPELKDPAALMLRLRSGFGVGIKADVLAFLIGREGAPATFREIAAATGYYGRAVRRAVEEMAAARFVRPARTTPASYGVNPEAWRGVLELPESPPLWRFWNANYAFVVSLMEVTATDRQSSPYVPSQETAKSTAQPGRVVERPAIEEATPYLQSRRARELVDQYGQVFAHHGIEMGAAEEFPGEAFLEPFAQGTNELLDRLPEFA